jgi:hypothetical protein
LLDELTKSGIFLVNPPSLILCPQYQSFPFKIFFTCLFSSKVFSIWWKILVHLPVTLSLREEQTSWFCFIECLQFEGGPKE